MLSRSTACGAGTLREQFARIGQLDAQVADIERRLRQWHQEDPASQRIAEIPGVGLLTASAAVATMGRGQSLQVGLPPS